MNERKYVSMLLLAAALSTAIAVFAAPTTASSASAVKADRLDDDDDGPSDPKRLKVRPTPGPTPVKPNFERPQKRTITDCDVAKPKPAHCKK